MMEKTRLKLDLHLPGIAQGNDQCIERLARLLVSKAGIDAAHALRIEGSPAQICIHFDRSVISMSEIREIVRRAGGDIDKRYGHFFASADATSAHSASAIESKLSRIHGVLEVVASTDGRVRIEIDREAISDETITAALVGLYKTGTETMKSTKKRPERPHDHSLHMGNEHSHGGILGKYTELIFTILCGVFLLTGWQIEIRTQLPRSASVFILALAYMLGGYFSTREALEKIRAGRLEIDFLMLIAAVGSAALGAWTEGALLLFLFSLGHALERYAMGKAKRAIEALAKLAPRTARVRRDGEETEVSVEQLQVGDIVIVKPDERVAADGFVVKGESSIDQAVITGESIPVDKQPVTNLEAAINAPDNIAAEHRVFAGTINQSGAIEVQVTKTASKNTLARIVEMVSEAETRVSPTQRFTKRFERYFVPSIVALVVLLLFAPLVLDEPFSRSFYRAMAVLVAASPCALAIATPSAILSGVARAARGGVLVKGGAPLERLGQLDSIAFDKTGTLTEGKPKVTDVRTAEEVTEAELLRTAIAVEALSDHPLAKAVVRDGTKKLGDESDQLPVAENIKSITGRGIEAHVDGKQTHIGKDELFAVVKGAPLPEEIRRIVDSLENDGRTTMIVRHGEQYLGVIGMIDTPRDGAKRTIAALRGLGIQRMIMISGDNQQVVDAVARAVGIDEARGDLMPEDKVAEIKKFNNEAGVAMVGDGVNDAPAMATASVGIAMGAAGSDVALETADVALMADNLEHLLLVIGLSRSTRRIIRQNLWISLGMVALLVPATLFGLNIGSAVALHEGSTLIVVFNALRLLAYKSASSRREGLETLQ